MFSAQVVCRSYDPFVEEKAARAKGDPGAARGLSRVSAKASRARS